MLGKEDSIYARQDNFFNKIKGGENIVLRIVYNIEAYLMSAGVLLESYGDRDIGSLVEYESNLEERVQVGDVISYIMEITKDPYGAKHKKEVTSLEDIFTDSVEYYTKEFTDIMGGGEATLKGALYYIESYEYIEEYMSVLDKVQETLQINI